MIDDNEESVTEKEVVPMLDGNEESMTEEEIIAETAPEKTHVVELQYMGGEVELKCTGWIDWKSEDCEYTGDNEEVESIIHDTHAHWVEKDILVNHEELLSKYSVNTYESMMKRQVRQLYDENGISAFIYNQENESKEEIRKRVRRKHLTNITERRKDLLKLAVYIQAHGGINDISISELKHGTDKYSNFAGGKDDISQIPKEELRDFVKEECKLDRIS